MRFMILMATMAQLAACSDQTSFGGSESQSAPASGAKTEVHRGEDSSFGKKRPPKKLRPSAPDSPGDKSAAEPETAPEPPILDSPDEPLQTLTDANGYIRKECVETKEPPKSVTGMKLVWHWQAAGTTKDFDQVIAAPVAMPLGATDEAPTIVFPGYRNCEIEGGAFLYAVDGASGSQKWVSKATFWPAAAAAMAKVNGKATIFGFGRSNKLIALDAKGVKLWESEDAALIGQTGAFVKGGPIVAQLDGIPVVVGQNVVIDARTGATRFKFKGAPFALPIVFDADGKHGLELATPTQILDSKGQVRCSFPRGHHHMAAAKVRATDEFATVFGVHGPFGVGRLAAYNAGNCAEIFDIQVTGGGGGPIHVADFDGDKVLDIGLAGLTKFLALRVDGSMIWSVGVDDSSSYQTGSTSADLFGTGKHQVVYADENFLRIFEGESGRVLYEVENSSGTLYEHPIIIDSGDGHAKVVLGANDSCIPTSHPVRGVRMFSAPDNDWVGTRRIWNQSAYDPLLVRDDGSVTDVLPDEILKPWLDQPHLIGFRGNVTHPAVKETADCQ